MPIPFRDAEEVEDLGTAAFLKIEPAPAGASYCGALFVVNARGEPLEFAYNRVELPDATFLWRLSDLQRHAHRRLTTSILSISSRTPRLLFCLADEVDSELFCRDIQLAIPAGRIGRPLKSVAYTPEETAESYEAPEPLHLFWFPAPPAEGTVERRLFDRLVTHGLLLEPFERAAHGLQEIYGGDLGA